MLTTDGAVLSSAGDTLLADAMIEGYVADLRKAATVVEKNPKDRKEVAKLQREVENLTVAVATGGDIPTLVAALKERQARHV
jgi:hypothetical protein